VADSAAESKAGTTAAACVAAAVTAGCPSTPPCRPLPDVLLLPFAQRLLMSAPPAAKPGRVFARSSSVSTAEHSAAQHSASKRHITVQPGPAQSKLLSAQVGKQDGDQQQLPANTAGAAGSQPAAAAGTPAPGTAAAEASRRHRRHTSPAVMQQQQHQVPSEQQQQQQQRGRQLFQTRLPFRTINSELPAAARTPISNNRKPPAAAAAKQDTPKGPLTPAWQTPAKPNSSSPAAAAAAAAAAPQSTPRAGAASTGLQAPAVNTPKAPLRSSLKGSRDRGTSRPAQQQPPPQKQQQEEEGENVATKPAKRVRFSGIGCSQEQQQHAAAGGEGGAPDNQQLQQKQPRPEPQQQPRVGAGAESLTVSAPSTPAVSAIPAPAAAAAVGEPGVQQWIAGVTMPQRKATASSSSGSSSRFFSGSNKTAPPAATTLLTVASATPRHSMGSWAGSSSGWGSSSSASRSQLPVLTVEELCGSTHGGLVPSGVTRQHLQEGTFIEQVSLPRLDRP
jgi:hypothetical protein